MSDKSSSSIMEPKATHLMDKLDEAVGYQGTEVAILFLEARAAVINLQNALNVYLCSAPLVTPAQRAAYIAGVEALARIKGEFS